MIMQGSDKATNKNLHFYDFGNMPNTCMIHVYEIVKIGSPLINITNMYMKKSVIFADILPHISPATLTSKKI